MGLMLFTSFYIFNMLIYSCLKKIITNIFTMYPKFQQQNY